MLLNHLTFYFYNISSPSYSSRSHPLLPAPFFPFSHPGMSPIQAGRPSLLPVARGHCHKRREDLNLINDQHESGQPASSIKSWSTLHWMYTFECVPVCVCVRAQNEQHGYNVIACMSCRQRQHKKRGLSCATVSWMTQSNHPIERDLSHWMIKPGL